MSRASIESTERDGDVASRIARWLVTTQADRAALRRAFRMVNQSFAIITSTKRNPPDIPRNCEWVSQSKMRLAISPIVQPIIRTSPRGMRKHTIRARRSPASYIVIGTPAYATRSPARSSARTASAVAAGRLASGSP